MKRERCPACLGYGFRIISRKIRAGVRYMRLSTERCKRCGGRGHLGGKELERGHSPSWTMQTNRSLGKLA